MKILFITDGLYPFVIGGMQKHASNLLRQFARSEHQIHVITAGNDQYTAEDYAAKIFEGLKPENISFEIIPFPAIFNFPGHYVIRSAMFSRQIYKRIRQGIDNYDLIYAKGFTGWYTFRKPLPGHPPFISQLHGLEMFQQPFGFRDRLVKFLLRIPARSVIRRSDFILSYGGRISKILTSLGKQPDQIVEQYGGVDEFWLFPPPEYKTSGERVFLYVARYEFRKGYHVLKQALKDLIDQKLSFQLHIVGDVPLHEHIRSEKVIYHGNLGAGELKDLKNHCDALVLCSLAEGFPTILVESMARGLTCIATDVGAVSAAVTVNNGWLIEPGSSVSLKNAMTDLISLDDHSLMQKKKLSRAMVEDNFQWNSLFNKLVSQLQIIADDYRQRSAGKKSQGN